MTTPHLEQVILFFNRTKDREGVYWVDLHSADQKIWIKKYDDWRAVEDTAKELYVAFQYDGPEAVKPPWVEGGNSLMQEKARELARQRLLSGMLKGHTKEPEAEKKFTPCLVCSNPVNRNNWHLPYCSSECKEQDCKDTGVKTQLTDREALNILGRILLGLSDNCHNFNPHTLFSRAEQLVNQQKCVVDNKEDLKCDTDKPSTLPEPITILIKSEITIHIP